MRHRPLPIDRLYLAHTLSEPAFGETRETIFYVKMADGRRSIVRQSLGTGVAEVVAAEPAPAGGVGYGGAIFVVRGGVLVYAAGDSRLHAIDLATGDQWPVAGPYEGVAAPALSPCGRYVAFLAEQDRVCNVLLTDLRGESLPIKLSKDPWYAFNPSFSPDGTRIAWQEWNEFDMPWDESRLVIARFSGPIGNVQAAAGLLPITTVRIEQPGVSYASPQFSPDGKSLAYTSDESGWRSLWIADADGGKRARIDTGPGEIGRPDWRPGIFAARWSGDGKAIYAVRRNRGVSALIRIAWPGGGVEDIETVWTDIEGVDAKDEQLVFIGSDPKTPPMLVTVDAATGRESRRASSGVGLIDPASLSPAEVLSWKTGADQTCWGILYRAVGSKADQKPRPMIVHIHGGPTSEVPVGWIPQAQYFATRGWHYLVVNYRGGTGYGRAYQEMLNGRWGVADVEDARSGAERLVASGDADPMRLVITGGSAGGYTTLMALTQDPDFWAAGVSLFGIGNMYEVREGSHRFEINYEQRLIGRLPEAGPVWKERSPLTHVARIQAPVLLFHGKEDKAVPHQQSVEFAEAVRRKGGVAELVSYEGEGHGFVKEANRRDMIERMEKFLEKYVICMQR